MSWCISANSRLYNSSLDTIAHSYCLHNTRVLVVIMINIMLPYATSGLIFEQRSLQENPQECAQSLHWKPGAVSRSLVNDNEKQSLPPSNNVIIVVHCSHPRWIYKISTARGQKFTFGRPGEVFKMKFPIPISASENKTNELQCACRPCRKKQQQPFFRFPLNPGPCLEPDKRGSPKEALGSMPSPRPLPFIRTP